MELLMRTKDAKLVYVSFISPTALSHLYIIYIFIPYLHQCSTGDVPFYWGRVGNSGKNRLGKLLEDLRSDFRDDYRAETKSFSGYSYDSEYDDDWSISTNY